MLVIKIYVITVVCGAV